MENLKKLVMYYSLEGNTKLIAEAIATEVGADLLELKPIKDVSPTGFMRFVWGGKQVMLKEKPELQPFDVKIEDYDVIYMGSPVWAGSYAPAFNTFFNEYKVTGKKIGLFGCYGGQEGKLFINYRNQLEGNEIIGEIGFKNPLTLSRQESELRAKEWARKY